MTEKIASTEELDQWLEDKPRDWGAALALRSALRVLPAIAQISSGSPLYLAALRSLLTAWASRKWSESASSAWFGGAGSAAITLSSKLKNNEVAYAAADAWNSAYWSVIKPDEKGRESAVRTAFHASSLMESSYFWKLVTGDAEILTLGSTNSNLSLDATPLWLGEPRDAAVTMQKFASNLLNIDPNYDFWIAWYDRRVAGSDSAFGLKVEDDKALVLRIMQQGESFWAREPNEVNADIAGWISEAQASGPLREPEPQNPIAPLFIENAEGRIDLDADAGNDAVQRDQEAAERHSDTLAVANDAIASCGGNSAAATRGALENYRAALGDTIDGLRPSSLILRGELLRQELSVRDRNDPDSNLPPITDTALLALRALVSAHNLLVGLDPALARRDEALTAPATASAPLSPQEAEGDLVTAVAAGIVTPEAKDALEAVIAAAPSIPDPANRNSRRLGEAFRNLGRAALGLVTRHVRKTLWGGTAMAVTSATIAGGPAAGGAAAALAYKLCQWTLKNEETLRRWFEGNEPMQRLIERLMEELRRLPLR